MTGAYLILLLVCLGTSFLLSGMEAGVFALSRLRIRQLMRKGNPQAKALHGYLEHPERFLWTIMVGNITANVVAFSLVVIALSSWLTPRPVAFALAVAASAGFFYAFFELLPKTLFRLFPNRLCLLLATPFRTVHLLFRPLVSIMAVVSRWLGGGPFTGDLFGNRDELRLVMQESAQSLTSEEQAMINRVMDLQNLKVRHVATPLSRTVCVSSDTPLPQILELCRAHGHSRMPVWESQGPNRRIVGLLSMRSILYQADLPADRTAGRFVTQALFLSEDMRLEIALRHLQRNGQRMAIVLGPDRKETGMISMQDILQAIFGEVSL